MVQEGKLMSGVRIGELLDFVRGQHPQPLARGKLLGLAGLGGLEKRRVDRLSGGQTQRVRFAMAIAGNPDLLILDEPTAAMDVEARRDFWVSMRAYAAEGRTILFATHYLEEAEQSASRLLIIARGQVIADGTVPEIQARYGEPRVAFTLLKEETPQLEQYFGGQRVEQAGSRVTLHSSDADTTVRTLVSSPLHWKDLEVRSNDLETTFLKLTHASGNKE
jgi:ABC-2 type transport system ATP-binding protein